MTLRATDLFAGMGGFGLAAQQAGLGVVYANEFDPYPAEMHDANFDVKVDRRSIADVTAEEVPEHDVILAGFPCQAFSIAGKRGGFEDERGRLFPHILRIATEHRTPLIVMENVKNLVTHDGGATLGTILRWLGEAGYYVSYRVLNSWQHAAIPQDRSRVYLVAALGRKVSPEVFPRPLAGLPDPKEVNVWRGLLDPAESIPERYWYKPGSQMYGLFERTLVHPDGAYTLRGRNGVWGLNDSLAGLVPTLLSSSGGGKVPSILDRVYKFHRANELRSGDLVPTMMANMGTGGGKVPMALEHWEGEGLAPRKFTERECARMQGFPDSYRLGAASATREYKALGNSVTVPLAQRVIENAVNLIA